MIGRGKARAFRLIELLIVVAIMAILAAIAVPNFLEAQTRAKVARVRADFRSIGTAIEAYMVDMGDYLRNWSGGYQLFTPDLSTPVAYLSTASIPDPFGVWMDPQHWHFCGYHRILPFWEAAKFPPDSPWAPDATSTDGDMGNGIVVGNGGALRKYDQWLLHSIGPDRVWWLFEKDWESHDTLCDPTNGTISFGNLARTQRHPEGKILYRLKPRTAHSATTKDTKARRSPGVSWFVSWCLRGKRAYVNSIGPKP